MKLNLFLSLVLISSCSLLEQDEQKEKSLSYSESTEKLFNEIEKSDLFKNRKMPPSKLTNSSSLDTRPSVPKNETKVEKIETTQIEPGKKLSGKDQDRLIEINQNLSIFCMKKQRNPKINTEEKCQKYTKELVDQCFKKHGKISSPLTACIKDHLKSMR